MNEQLIEKYELKSPSYDLQDRSYPIQNSFKENSRYYYDTNTQMYRSKAADKQEIRLLFAGDLLCQEDMVAKFRTQNGFDFSPCFEYVRPLLRSADFSVGNLETPVSHTAPYRGEIISHEGPYYCNAPLHYLESLNYAGFDMLYTANNHTIDAGTRGLLETISNTRQFGMIQTGTFADDGDRFAVVDICGIKVGFVSFATRFNDMEKNLTKKGRDILLNAYSDERAKTIYEAMIARGAEFTVVFPHWGKEYTDVVTPSQKNAAEFMAQTGYDLVVGSHAHVIQKATTIGETPVLYSMGNLISHLNAKASVREISALTVLYSLTLKRHGNQILSEVGVIPCKILRDYQNNPFTVIPLTAGLNLPPDLKTALNTAADTIKNRIDCEALPVLTDYALLAEETAAYQSAMKHLPAKLQTLLPAKKHKGTPVPKVLDQVSDRGGIYLIYKDHAELVHLVTPSGSSSFAPPAEVKKKPVTIYSSFSKGNDVTRIFYIPASVEVVGPGMFKDFVALESVRSFRGLKVISMGAFENCKSMTGLIFAESLMRIEDFAFRGCSKLISVKLPDSVNYIADNAFEGCGKLTIYCNKNSYADAFAKKHRIPVKYMGTAVMEDFPASTENDPNFPFNGPARLPLDNEQMHAIRQTLPPVPMGPRNGPQDRHPQPILDACAMLGHPLPEDAVCGNQPSFYLGRDLFDGTLATVEALLGSKKPKMAKDLWEQNFRRFRYKYQGMECLDRNATDFTVYFVDFVCHARPMGFNYDDYFDFEFYNKEPAVRATFFDDDYRLHIYRTCVPKEFRNLFKDKALFNKKYSEFIHRDWVDISSCSYAEFEAFASKHSRFSAKPLNQFGGYGAHVVDTSKDTLENLYTQLRQEAAIAEELIVQHDDVAAFNASTLNTVRVFTILDANNIPHVLWAVARFGRKGSVVDNFHGGGVGAIIDVDTGLIVSEAINRAHFTKPIHPDSKLVIPGFQYPMWDKIKSTAEKAALVTPQVRSVGWDFAVTKNGDVELVEGNSRSGAAIVQSANQTGKKYLYDAYFPAIEQLVSPKKAARKNTSHKKAKKAASSTKQPQKTTAEAVAPKAPPKKQADKISAAPPKTNALIRLAKKVIRKLKQLI